MKKLLSIFLALSLLLVPALALAEGAESDPAAAVAGDWYGEMNGLVLRLTLNGDGGYSACLLSAPQEAQSGAWAYDDGYIHLDGSDIPDINVLSPDVMKWTAFDLFLRREAQTVYAPAEPITEGVTSEVLNGCWKAQYAGVDGLILPAAAVGGETVIYIEGADVALTGGVFDDTVLPMAFADGALTWEGEGVSVALALQGDGFLRLTLAAGEDGMTLYLLPHYVQGLSPEPPDAPAEP